MIPPPLPLGRIIQYAYTVADIQQSIATYVDAFDVGPWFVRGPFTPTLARYRGAPTSPTLTLARAFVGDSMIELIQQHDDGPSVYREFDLGFHHWAIGTDSMDADLARYTARGWAVAFEDEVPSGARIVYLEARPDLPGMVEIVEMNGAQRTLYESFQQASIDWDGTDPVRYG